MSIPSWSHTKIVLFQTCKRAAYLKYDQRIPEPPRPLPPGKTEHANDRGTRIHEDCERFVRGEQPDLCIEADKYFGMELMLLRELYKDNRVAIEGEWGMNKDWEPTEWKTAWLRLKLDAIVFHSEVEATAIDYKTGRKFGNEIKHAEQLQLYQLVTFLRYPKLEKVTTELWYLDQDEVTRQTFTRSQGLRFKANFDRRGNELTNCTDFPPNPNMFSCKYCMYGPWGSGHCPDGVQKK